jgi:DNA uptake protein ComE-like DNA-binding protein
VPSKVAEAIVAARVQTGGFRSLDDLAKVPGLDASKIEGRKARILF